MAKEHRAPGSGDKLSEFVDELQAGRRYTFERNEALKALHANGLSLRKAAMRLAAKGRIVVPRRGFYVIVPIEYRAMGAPPPSWFIDDLMRHLGRPYYVGILSAAALHGAGHQQPQEFQVVTDRPQRLVLAGRMRIRFLVKRHLQRAVTATTKTETGAMRISTPEATAIDLIRYVSAAGGLNNIATVLAELAQGMDGQKLINAAQAEDELACLQRLGHILDLMGAGVRSAALAEWIDERKPRSTPLRPGIPIKGSHVDPRWRVIVNEKIEVDL
jgi:predicted transcriptional regulator of viral defense system